MEKIRYVIEYNPGIEEKLAKLATPVLRVIKEAIERKLIVDPVAFGKPLRYSLKGLRRLRVGDYRVVYKIEDSRVVVIIIDIEHRKNIYDRD